MVNASNTCPSPWAEGAEVLEARLMGGATSSPTILDMAAPIVYGVLFLFLTVEDGCHPLVNVLVLRSLGRLSVDLACIHACILVYYLCSFMGFLLVTAKFMEVLTATMNPPLWLLSLTSVVSPVSGLGLFACFVQMGAVGVYFLAKLKKCDTHWLDRLLNFLGFCYVRTTIITVGILAQRRLFFGCCFGGLAVVAALGWMISSGPLFGLEVLVQSSVHLSALLVVAWEVGTRLLYARRVLSAHFTPAGYLQCFSAMIFSTVMWTFWTSGDGHLSCLGFMLALFVNDFVFMSLFLTSEATTERYGKRFRHVAAVQVLGVLAAARLKCKNLLEWLDDLPRQMGISPEEYLHFFAVVARDDDSADLHLFWGTAVMFLLGSLAQVDALPASPTRDCVVAQLFSRKEALVQAAAHAQKTGDCTRLNRVLQYWTDTHWAAHDLLGIVFTAVVGGDVTMCARLQAGVANPFICAKVVHCVCRFLCVSAFTGHKLDQTVARRDFAASIYYRGWFRDSVVDSLSNDEFERLRTVVFASVEKGKKDGEPTLGLPFYHNQLLALVPFMDRCCQEDLHSVRDFYELHFSYVDLVQQALKIAERWSPERDAWCATTVPLALFLGGFFFPFPAP
jgi:hypothetical protein